MGQFYIYIGKETSYITNIFRQTDLKIVLRTKKPTHPQKPHP